jgi:predicted 2-oxoglutarate/Fe(II)-dependent dioxygenase YbiX
MLPRHDFAADFVLPTPEGVPTRFFGLAGGRTTLLVFVPPEANGATLRELSAVAEETDSALFVVLAEGAASDLPGVKAFVDAQAQIRRRYRVDDGLCLFVLSENLRVIDSCSADHAACARAAIAGARRLPSLDAAPVLLIPHALDHAMCDRLVALVDSEGPKATGVERSRDGRRQLQLAPDTKRRHDVTLEAGPLMAELTAAVGKRVMPEVLKAFSFRATRFEGFKVARYEAESGGFFGRHRDNLSPRTSHRRFAVSLHLNDGYQGGELQFPEYGSARYRLDKGGAVVFSGSLMHEVLPVTQGKREVLLTFLFSEQDRRPASAPR